MIQVLKALLDDEIGASIVEYALIIGVLVVPIALLLSYGAWFFPWVLGNIANAVGNA